MLYDKKTAREVFKQSIPYTGLTKNKNSKMILTGEEMATTSRMWEMFKHAGFGDHETRVLIASLVLAGCKIEIPEE